MEIPSLVTAVTILFEKLWKAPLLPHLTATTLLGALTHPKIFENTQFYEALQTYQPSLNLALLLYGCFIILKLMNYISYLYFYILRLITLKTLSENERKLIRVLTTKEGCCETFNSDLPELNSLLRKKVFKYPKIFVGGVIGFSTVELSDWAKTLIYRHKTILTKLHTN
ncbi:hypothetical protein ACJO1G_18290 [Vibrio parahaemolyticus]|uniref:hypothetical protein n=1 Tax=Vibrio parahaemolyticus TaxID=670 RepID=UPI00387B6A92